MKYTFLCVVVLIGLLSNCSQKNDFSDSMNQEQFSNMTMDSILLDTMKVLAVSSPDMIDTVSQILVHKVYLESKQNWNERQSSFSWKKSDYSYSEKDLINLIFENSANKTSSLLTNNKVNILSYDVVRESKKKATAKFILYQIIDNDWNRNKKLDSNYIISLYTSNIDGSNFCKITNDKESFSTGEWLSKMNRYYFKTYEDSNKNGFFENSDKTRYYYIEFEDQSYQIVEYNPLNILNKNTPQ